MPNEARRESLEEWQNVTALELAADDYITCRVNSVDLKNRLCDVETDCRDCLHVWLLRIVGALPVPTSMALPCRWRSRPQHQKRTLAHCHSITSSARAMSCRGTSPAAGSDRPHQQRRDAGRRGALVCCRRYDNRSAAQSMIPPGGRFRGREILPECARARLIVRPLQSRLLAASQIGAI